MRPPADSRRPFRLAGRMIGRTLRGTGGVAAVRILFLHPVCWLITELLRLSMSAFFRVKSTDKTQSSGEALKPSLTAGNVGIASGFNTGSAPL